MSNWCNAECTHTICVYAENNKPHFNEACGHGGFLKSYQLWDGPKAGEWVDVYLFNEPRQQSVCIRYGNEPHEYISPGTPIDVIRTSARYKDPKYQAAVMALLECCKVMFETLKG